MTSVAESWGKAKGDWEAKHGPEFFMTLFEKAEDTYKPFADSLFKGKPVSAVKDTDEMKRQSKAFGDLISNWVANINDAEKLKGFCDGFSTSHKARKISKDQVTRAFAIFVDFMGEKFGADKAAWSAVTKSLLGMITLD